MTLSGILACFSLMGYLAICGQALWKTREMGKDSWGLYKHGFDKMPNVIEWALRYCLNQGFIVIEDRNSAHFVQFRKYILRTGEYGLELGFPEADWSKTYFPKLSDALTADGVPFRVAREPGPDVTAFIHVDCGQDIDRAVDLTRLCFFEIFGLPPEASFKSSPSNYSTVYDDVDDPDYANPSSCSGWWSTFRAREQERERPDPVLSLKAAAFTLGYLICYPALWLSWYLADNATPDWQFAFGFIQASGGHATWLLLLVFCGIVVGARRAWQRLAREVTPRPRTMIDRIGGRAATYGLAAAVLASWLGA